MTIFVDPYHTTAGMILDMSRTITPLKECTIRDSLNGTNLGVRSNNGVTPVFITGSRDSEKSVPAFTHPILIKNFNGQSYLFTDVTLFVSAGATLSNIDTHIRRREEFEFTRSRAIASLAWASGDVAPFKNSMGFVGAVFVNWMGQALARNFALPYMDQVKVQVIAAAFYATLFEEGAVVYSQNTDMAIQVARRAAAITNIPFTAALDVIKSIDTPMMSIHDFCNVVVQKLNNVNLSPTPGVPGSGFNFTVLLNLIADAWYSANSKPILAVALEHPPTLAAIVYYCMNYNNFRRQTMGQIIQQASKAGSNKEFNVAFKTLLEEYTKPEAKLRPVMEYLNHNVLEEQSEDTEVDALLAQLHGENQDHMNKVVETSEDSQSDQFLAPLPMSGPVEGGTPGFGGNDPNSPAPLDPGSMRDGMPMM